MFTTIKTIPKMKTTGFLVASNAPMRKYPGLEISVLSSVMTNAAIGSAAKARCTADAHDMDMTKPCT